MLNICMDMSITAHNLQHALLFFLLRIENVYIAYAAHFWRSLFVRC